MNNATLTLIQPPKVNKAVIAIIVLTLIVASLIALGKTEVSTNNGQLKLSLTLRDSNGNCEGHWDLLQLNQGKWDPSLLGMDPGIFKTINHGPCEGTPLYEWLRDVRDSLPRDIYKKLFDALIKKLGL